MVGLPAGGGGVGALGGSSTGAASAGAADDQICRNIRIQSSVHSHASTIFQYVENQKHN